MKYIIVALGAFISCVACWKILTTPDIPFPFFQCVIFTTVIMLLTWMLLGFPAIKTNKNNNETDNRVKSTIVKSINKNKVLLITLASLLAAVLIIGSVISFIWLMSANSKIPATIEEVWLAIEEVGYEPEDITETYHSNDVDAVLSLKQCIAFKKDDIEFQYLVFNNRDSAVDFWGTIYQKITLRYNSFQKIETEYYVANYRIYTLDSLGKYNVAIYVDNTAVYAYCDSENKNEINKILKEIDYLEFGNNKETVTQ